jgi:hypothetical protein
MFLQLQMDPLNEVPLLACASDTLWWKIIFCGISGTTKKCGMQIKVNG